MPHFIWLFPFPIIFHVFSPIPVPPLSIPPFPQSTHTHTHTHTQIFAQSLESWKLKNPGQPVSPQRPVGVLDYLTEEEIERYRSAAHATQALMELYVVGIACSFSLTITYNKVLPRTDGVMAK